MISSYKAPLPVASPDPALLSKMGEVLTGLPEDTIFVDLFGGSGLLACICKDLYPQATVVFNDTSNYLERVENITDTEALRLELISTCQWGAYNELLSLEPLEKAISARLADGTYIDWTTLSSWLCGSYLDFATTLTELCSRPLHNYIPSTPYSAEGLAAYRDGLDGLDITSWDFREVLDTAQYMPEAMLFVAPPERYKGKPFSHKDYTDLLLGLRGNRFLLFSRRREHYAGVVEDTLVACGFENPLTGAAMETCREKDESGMETCSEIMYYKIGERESSGQIL